MGERLGSFYRITTRKRKVEDIRLAKATQSTLFG